MPQLFQFARRWWRCPCAARRADGFYPGAYDASFGRYAGGIIDAKTRAARSDGYHGELELRLFDLSALVELPLPKDVRITLSGHYGYPGPIIHAIDSRVDVGYWDYQLRLDWKG